MSNIPSDLRYANSHEWVKDLGDGTVLVGITDYAQSALGDITYVELPRVGTALSKGAGFGVVESVKAASDLYAPVAGRVIETNAALESAPETVNSDPYEAGWMLKLKLDALGDFGDLLDAEAYAEVCA